MLIMVIFPVLKIDYKIEKVDVSFITLINIVWTQ